MVNNDYPGVHSCYWGNAHDANAMDKLSYEPGSFYIFDRVYVYGLWRLFVIHKAQSFFVIRAKNNLQFKRQHSASVNILTGIQCDQIAKLKGFYSFEQFAESFWYNILFIGKEKGDVNDMGGGLRN